jgi:hypothetical protein
VPFVPERVGETKFTRASVSKDSTNSLEMWKLLRVSGELSEPALTNFSFLLSLLFTYLFYSARDRTQGLME